MKHYAFVSLAVLPLFNNAVFAQQSVTTQNQDWTGYIDTTTGNSEKYVFIDAYDKYLADKKPGIAVDFGSGAGNEDIFLAKRGWQVYAYDSSKRSGEILSNRSIDLKGKINFQLSDFDSAILPKSFNFFISLYSLPFGNKESLPILINKVSTHMKKNGVFAANFFGEKADFVKSGKCYSVTEDEIRTILEKNNFQIKYLLHRTYQQFSASMEKTNFDLFDVIAIKI
ncbi:methyltransferase domain-containing protein [Pigmentibacter ruber]|uniref:methyltransferase domain-containing protein n=1 Tax=Pigmentibacter ruber TaxID=2683196 RepID=UPI00131CDEBF|nr:methyltransferase domain-containing protein [Pigmentibacter ruber]